MSGMIGTMAHALSHVAVELGPTLEQKKSRQTMVVISVSDLLLCLNHATLKNAQAIKDHFNFYHFCLEYFLILYFVHAFDILVYYDLWYSSLRME